MSKVDIEALKLRLMDPALKFGERLKLAAMVDLHYWENRNPPNLPRATFENLIRLLDDDAEPKRWSPRESDQGTHAHDGEDRVFHLEIEVNAFGRIKTFYIKGFFFEKGRTRGVEIQSCRDDTMKLLVFSSRKK